MSDSHSSDDTQGVQGVDAPTSEATAAPASTQAAGASPPPAAAGAKAGAQPVPKRWYIVHTYSGQEARAKQSLLERAAALGFEE